MILVVGTVVATVVVVVGTVVVCETEKSKINFHAKQEHIKLTVVGTVVVSVVVVGTVVVTVVVVVGTVV